MAAGARGADGRWLQRLIAMGLCLGIGKRELMDRPISEEVERLMKRRERGAFSTAQGTMIPLFHGEAGEYTAAVVVPILAGGDAIGAVLMLSKEASNMGEVELKLCETAAHFMGKQMET